MKYVLYFEGYENNTYFYESIKELVNDWDCFTLQEFIKEFEYKSFLILKIEEIVYEKKDKNTK